MQSSDRAVFLQGLSRLAASYRATLTTEQVDAYWHALVDVPWARIERGLLAAARDGGRYMPSAAQVREMALAADVPSPARQESCDWCEGTGWLYTQIDGRAGARVSAVAFCACGVGQRRRQSWLRRRQGTAA